MIPDLVPAAAEQVSLLEAMVRLPLAAALGSALAMRPRRAGTPPRKPAVVQTQVILAVMGALVLIVVGASLARAFGVVGIAGLIRYRAKVDDPKDASVMLAGLGVGLACGVGLLYLAIAATAFLLALLWVLESKEADLAAPFTLEGDDRGPCRSAPAGGSAVRRHKLGFELRSWGQRGAGLRRGRAAGHEDRRAVDELGRPVRQGQGRRRVGREKEQMIARTW